MTTRDRLRKHEQRRAHAERRDLRQPGHELTANERRDQLRDERREARKAAA